MTQGDLIFTPYTAENKAEWDGFVAECDAGWLYHTSRFIDGAAYSVGAEHDYARDSFSIRLPSNPGRIVAIGVFAKIPYQRVYHLFGPGLALSPACRKNPLADQIKNTLTAYALERGCAFIKMHLPPMAPANVDCPHYDSVLAKFGFYFGGRDADFDYVQCFISSIDLHQGIDKITAKLGTKRRAEVKVCANLNLTTAIGGAGDAAMWAEFVELHRFIAKRNGFPPYTERQLTTLRGLVDSGDCAVANLYENGSCISSLFLETYKKNIWYLAGSGNERCKDIGGMSYIHLKAMEWMAERGYHWYCLGVSSATRLNGPAQFKRQFGGDRWDYLVGDLVCDKAAFNRNIKLLAALRGSGIIPPALFKAVSSARKLLRRATGR